MMHRTASQSFFFLEFIYVVILQRVFLEGNPYLLVITMVVSLLHSVFDFLAFKNGKGFNCEPSSLLMKTKLVNL